jgi:hypothetical protein
MKDYYLPYTNENDNHFHLYMVNNLNRGKERNFLKLLKPLRYVKQIKKIFKGDIVYE